MLAIGVEIVSQTASFRNPEFQNFHKTLDFPPPTTITGLTGAALGLSPKMAQEFVEEAHLKLGIASYNRGKTTDTWKYNRRTTQMHLYDPLLDGSVIQREILFFNNYLLCFCSENETFIDQLIDGFTNPTFALTMGNSDALAKVKRIIKNPEFDHRNKIENCLVAGDVLGDVIHNSNNGLTFSIYQTSEPLTYDLPVRFDYKSDYGKRTVTDTKTFSFIGQAMQLNYDLEGVLVDNVFIPIFDW